MSNVECKSDACCTLLLHSALLILHLKFPFLLSFKHFTFRRTIFFFFLFYQFGFDSIIVVPFFLGRENGSANSNAHCSEDNKNAQAREL
jgi:hypothetical protein